MLLTIRSKLAGEKLHRFPKLRRSGSLNPTFVWVLEHFSCFLSDLAPPARFSVNPSSAPSILLGPSLGPELSTVALVTSRGCLALGQVEINQYFADFASRLGERRNLAQRWRAFAPFCFSVFCVQETPECFSTAFSAYCHLFSSTRVVPLIGRQEAGARILILIRMALVARARESLLEHVRASGWVFRKPYADVWRFWLQEVVVLALEPWFFDIASELFGELAYRSALYATKYGNANLRQALQKLFAASKAPVPILMMDKLETFCQSLFEIDNAELTIQVRVRAFVTAAMHLSEKALRAIDLVELRQHPGGTSDLETALEKIPMDVIKRMGNLGEFVNRMRMSTELEREEAVRIVTESSAPLSQHQASLDTAVHRFNAELPFPFPIRFESGPQLSIFRIARHIDMLSPEVLALQATTSLDSNYTFLVQRSQRPGGLRACVTTIATVLSLAKHLLQISYPARQRGLQFSGLQLFEVGTRMLLVAMHSEIVNLCDLFLADEMRTPNTWVQKFIKNGRLTVAGRRNAETFRHTSLSNCFLKIMDRATFVTTRKVITRSYAASSFMHYVFRTPYAPTERVLACLRTGEMPLLGTDFDIEHFVEHPEWSPIRLSPCVVHAMGPTGEGEFVTAIGAIGLALTASLETLRAFLDVVVSDMALDDPRISPASLIAERTKLENRIVELGPPTNPETPAPECTRWLESIENLVAKAKNSKIQPAEAIPWY
jgi:hypothetical protein